MRQTNRHLPVLDVMQHIKADYHRSKHIKTHQRDVKCTITGCRSGGFYRNQDLERHVSSRHKDATTERKLYFCGFQDAPRLDFQERITVKDICDFVITLLSNHLKDSAGLVISVPTAIKILNGMSSAVTEVPQPIVNSFFVHLQDLNLPRLGSQGSITVKDICDSVMTLRNNRQDDFARYEQLLRLVNDMHAIKSVPYSTYTDEEKFWSFADELGT